MQITRILLFLSSMLFESTLSDEATHQYDDGEVISVWMNKVGPFNNPTETYPYFSSHVPFCNRAEHIDVKHHEIHYTKFDGLGSILEGNNLVHSGIPIKFKQAQTKQTDCHMKLDKAKASELVESIKQRYWYQVFIDDLPVWGMVGEYLPLSADTAGHHHANLAHVEEEHFEYDALTGKHVETYPHVFTHKAFSLAYNGDRVIEINLTSEDPVLIKEGQDTVQDIEMFYSVQWVENTKIEFRDRFDRYLDFQFFEHQIHWFALWNSFMLVIFLVGMVAMVVMRALRKDYEKMNSKHDDDMMDYESFNEETGWKKLHGDVFRRPPHLTLFSAIVGTGYQIYTGCLLVILLAIAGKAYDTRGTVITSCVSTYAVTSLVAGYFSAQTFLSYSSKKDESWKTAMAWTGVLFPSIGFLVTFLLNLLSVSYNATNAVSFGTYCVILLIWALSLVLLFVGTLVGRSSMAMGNRWPAAVNKNFVHPIPSDRPWFMNPVVFCSLVGVLPFGSIFIEMYYIFNSFWNYKFYYVYGFMLLVFVILTIVTACVTIVSTYILLNAEDRRWKWVSIFSGGSTALYVFAYATFYFATKTQMSGMFQTSFYFGYMFLFSLTIFFMCATIGYVATSYFVKKIYTDKFD